MRNTRKLKTGKITSDKVDKTRTVVVERLVRHALYGKIQKRFSKFTVHDDKNESKNGDTVRIMECRPISKTKRWRLIEIIEKCEKDSINEI